MLSKEQKSKQQQPPSLQGQQKQKQKHERPIVYQVTTGSLSDYTKKSYTYQINDFLAFYKITSIAGIEPLKEYSPKLIRQMVLDYVIFLRDEGNKSRASIKMACAALSFFFYVIRDDDARLNWTKVKMEFPPDEHIRRDRAYTVEEIQKMLDVGCSGRLREKVIILLLTSTGMRIGGIHTLKFEDLYPKQTNHGKVYQIQVYSGTSSQYYCYCNVETAKAMDAYLKERTDKDEVLTKDSPLIRDLRTLNIRNVKPLSVESIRHIVSRIVEKSDIRNTFQFTGEAKRSKGFRKWYKTQAEESGMKPIHVEKTYGHSIGISSHYYRPQESDILQDYMSTAADALTIDPNQRLEQENQDLKTVRAQEIERLEAQLKTREEKDLKRSAEWQALKNEMDELKTLVYPLYPGVPRDKQRRAIWWKLYKAQRNERGEDVSDWPDEIHLKDDDDDHDKTGKKEGNNFQ